MALEESSPPPAGGDFVRPFVLEIPGFLGRLVRLGATVDAVLTPEGLRLHYDRNPPTKEQSAQWS